MGCSAWPDKKEEKTCEWKMAKVRFHLNSLMLPWKPQPLAWICLVCGYGRAVSQESWWINQVQWNTLELWWNIDHKKSCPHCCTLPREDREFKDSGNWNLITILIENIYMWDTWLENMLLVCFCNSCSDCSTGRVEGCTDSWRDRACRCRVRFAKGCNLLGARNTNLLQWKSTPRARFYGWPWRRQDTWG